MTAAIVAIFGLVGLVAAAGWALTVRLERAVTDLTAEVRMMRRRLEGTDT
jgi:hypothetical protein